MQEVNSSELKPSRLEYRNGIKNLEGYKLFLSLIIFFIPDLFSQELVTDRPDQTESAVTVPSGTLQIETGFIYERDDDNGIAIDNYSLAGTLLRYGLLDNLELRLGAGYSINRIENLTNSGIGGIFLGAKINFLTEENSSLDLGLLLHTLLPLGNKNFRPESVEPEVVLSLAKSLSDKFSLGVNIGGSHNTSFEEIVYLYTTALGYSVTDKLGVFTEVFGNFSSSIKPEHLYDGGFTYLLSNYLQIDISGGKRFTGNNSYWFIGTGVSIRTDKL